MDSQEKEISFVSLFRYILKRWRSIVVTAIVFALIFAGLGYHKESQRLSTPIESIEKEMASDEKNYVLKIKEMDKEFEQLKYYVENSAIMNLDPYNVQCASVSYFVDTKHIINYAGDTESDLIWDIISTYESKLNSSGWKTEALRAAGSDIDLKFFNEMVSISTSGRTFTVTIKYPDPDQLKIIMSVLQENIQEFREDILKNIGTHSLALTDNSMEASVLDRELKAFQEDKKYLLSNMYDEINELKDGLNENQKNLYYGRILSRYELNTGIIGDQIPQAGFSVKKFVMGGILGGFLMLFIYCIRFFTLTVIHVEDNYESILGIANLGFTELPLKKKLNFINRKIRNSELGILDGLNSEEQFEVILTAIKRELGEADCVYLDCIEGDEFALRLSDSLTKAGVKCHLVSNIMSQSGALNSGTGVAFIIRTDFSKYPQLLRKIKFCKVCDAKLLGTAVEIS